MSDNHPRIAFVASTSTEAREARERLARRYGDAEPDAADIIVALSAKHEVVFLPPPPEG